MPKLFKDFFYFSRTERRGILLLIAAICLGFLAVAHITAHRDGAGMHITETAEDTAARLQYEEFIASLQEMDKSHTERYRQRNKYAANERKKSDTPPPVLSLFNPNTADSASFRRLGLPAWMVKNILNYRAKGGKFRRAEDFRKIYGLTDEQYATLSPYIYIAPEDTASNTPRLYTPQPALAKSEKYAAGTVINLNLADTTELKKIPGIGSGLSRLIAGYRQQLGGFYQVEQLREINLDTEMLKDWFSTNPADIRRINLNRAGVERLRSHPYINFYQAKAIVEHRKKKGKLTSLKPFALYEEFTEEDLERISHYVCFE